MAHYNPPPRFIEALTPNGKNFATQWLGWFQEVWQNTSTTTWQVTQLPSPASAGVGARSFVRDATATTFASVVVGGGANPVPVYSDGVNWRIG